MKFYGNQLSSKGFFQLYRVGTWREYGPDKAPIKELGTSYSCVLPSGERMSVKVRGVAAITQEQVDEKIETDGLVLVAFENLVARLYMDYKTNEQRFTATADGIRLAAVDLPVDFGTE